MSRIYQTLLLSRGALILFSQIVILIASLQQTFADLPLWISFS